MEIGQGKRVKIRYQCRIQDRKVCHLGDSDTLDFIIGGGTVPPSFERAIMEMQPGDHRKIRVPAAEVRLFQFRKSVESENPPGVSYDFGPGEGGDVSEFIPPRLRQTRPDIPPGTDLDLDVELLAVEDPNVK